ncbi:MAG: Ig-like domain-containing protein [Gemmatimonadaceae bacterium]
MRLSGLFLIVPAFLAACGGGGDGGKSPTAPGPAAVASVDVSPGSSSLAPSGTVQLSATPKDASGNALSGRTVTWTSSAPTVASVSTSGLVTALTVGNAEISAASEGRTGTATVSVVSPIATISLDHSSEALVAGQTLQLTATTKDAGGAVLTGRTLTWTTSAPAVATVSSTGLVTALTAGTATIGVAGEGKSATAAITVTDGGIVSANGATVSAAAGNVKIDVPAGAAPVGTAITVQEVPAPATGPTGAFLSGAFYKFGPEGTTFSAPVRVTLKYDPTKLPPWANGGDLGIQRLSGGQWNQLANIVVDTAAHTISGTTTGFSAFGASANAPAVTLSPNKGQINYNQRSVVLSANVAGHQANQFQYSFQTTGMNGAVGAQFTNTIQYTGSTPILPDGIIDGVWVDVKAPTSPGGPLQVIGTARADISTDLGLTFELNPWTQLVDIGKSVPIQALVRERNGNLYQGKLRYTYVSTGYIGTISPASGVQTTTNTVTYQALPAAAQTSRPPRGDKITVTFYVEHLIPNGTLQNPNQYIIQWDQLGTTDAFVEVGKDVYIGHYSIETQITNPATGFGCVYVYFWAPKTSPAQSYALHAYGFNDPGGLGSDYTRTFSGPTGSGFTAVVDAGTDYKMGVQGGCGSPSNITFRQNLYNANFAGTVIEVKVTP